jgi:Calcium-activated BK potassium channel alpha subunit
MSLLAHSCVCPGFCALVSNLARSHAPLPPVVLSAGSWLAEYYTVSVHALHMLLQHI